MVYSQILQDDDLISDDEKKQMYASIEKASQDINSLISDKKKNLDIANKDNIELSDTKEQIKVLIVDDYEDNRLALKLILKKYPLKLFFAKNGLESVEIANKNGVDLIFMDLHLPDINGIEASKQIKKELPDTTIISLSGDIDAVENEKINDFIFSLHISKPFNRDELKSVVEEFIETKKDSSLENTTSNQKIVIIDDKVENLTLFRDILKSYKYDIEVSSSGMEAFDTIKRFHPDLILLDVVMPQMDGFEVLEKLKRDKSTRDIPVIFLTANNSSEDIVKGFESGVVDYVAKPFHPRELIARVDTHLKQAKLFANLKRLMEHSFHELYTPLSVIKSSMQMQELEYEKTDYTQMSLAASKTLQNIYDDLYYSINYDNISKEKSSFDLSELLLERIKYFELVAKSRSLVFSNKIADCVNVELNKSEIERVIDNLLSNALKYTQEENEINIFLDNDNNGWSLSVCNPSSKNVDVEKIFLKYYREKENVFGLGLGLELVQSICHKNNIKISASNDNRLFCINMEYKNI
jgi:CheY-like chemotaxis protein